MPDSESTCWTAIRAAAAGSPAGRDELARRYLGPIRAYLAARWRGSPLAAEVDDAAQDVFVECFRQGGAFAAAGAGRVPHFRPFLYGVVRNVARRFEARPVRAAGPPPDVPADEATQSRLFDRAWAESVMAEAAACHRQRAAAAGPEAVRRVELLRLRFEDGLPVRAIAELWGVPAADIHHWYAQARREFRAALLAVVAFHLPGSPAEVEEEAAGLLRALA